MKKLMSWLLVFAMLLSFVPAGATAAGSYYVAGVSDLCGSNWDAGDANNQMTLNEESGLYEKVFTDIPAGTYECKVTDGTWDNSWGTNGQNYKLTTEAYGDVTITFNAETYEVGHKLTEKEAPAVKEFYLFGYIDNADVTAKDLKFENGKLRVNFTAADNYVFVKDSDGKSYMTEGWLGFGVTSAVLGAYTNGDKLHVPGGEHDLVLTDNGDGTLTLEVKEPVNEELYVVAGTEGLCGTGWNPGDLNNQMHLNENGLYEITYFSVPEGKHEFKVTDGTWDNSWGTEGNNFGFVTTGINNVTITFNAETKEIEVTTTPVNFYTVAGTDGLCGSGWNPGDAANQMFLDTDGLYKKTFKSVPAGKHECKVTDGTWDNSWGVEGGNYVFTTDDVYNVTIIFNEETKELSHELSEATSPDPVVPVDYPITVKVHYYRPDGNYANWEVHMWNGSGQTTVSSTRAFEEENVEFEGTTYERTATYFTNSNETWVGFIVKTPDWTKDPDGDRKIDISDVLSGTVHVYAKSGSALEDFDVVKDDCVKGAKITGAKWDSMTDVLTVTTSMAVEGDLMAAFTLFEVVGKDEIPVEITSVTKTEGKNEYVLGHAEGSISKEKAYRVYFNGASCDVTIPNTYSTKEFESQFTYEGDDLGATWTAESTTFRVWAPTAAEVFVNLYTAGEGGESLGQVAMTADVNGTWVATVEGDLNGTYYTYSVNIQGKTAEACDPYARTTGVNGNRAMVIDLDSTDPAGWENDEYVTQENYTDAVIWELHVRDFSIDESSGMVNKGKFLAFTEEGTTVPGTEIKTGVDYMVDLGVNYVHLLPVYDINSVDETTGGYNWGYDPKNYNVPEGSYSTDPYNGAVRVNEFKQMVQSLHDNNIGVVMDVVYNHVADAGNFCFNQIVPGYFSRIHDDGAYQSNSGCGNDTASERTMVRKYIVDSVLYWAEEYHIDGFRWDLVGLIDYETINAVMEEVHKVNPDIIFYGEGWEMCSWTTKDEGEYADDPYSKKMTIQPNDKLVNTEAGTFAFFNDTIRNVIHGGVFTATDKGFVCGFNDGNRQTVIDGYMAYSKWGSNSERVDTPFQTINYASCHDNYTLFDNFTVDALSLYAMDVTAENAASVASQAARYNNLAAAYYITAQGVPFIHAGEEMLRSKPTTDAEGNFAFDHNSYSSGDGVNSFKWSELQNELNSASYEYYKGLIAFRKAHPALRMTEQSEILAAMESLNTGNDQAVAILNNGGKVESNKILTIINVDENDPYTCTLPEGEWNVYVNSEKAGTEVIKTVEGTVNVSACSAMILVQEGETEPTFEDVPASAYCYDAVEWAVENGITTGVTNTTFVPLREVTRAEVVTFLWRAAGSPVVESDKSFDDVTEADFFYDAVIWAAENGITTGKGANQFAPKDTCTRAEAVTFLWRAEGEPSRSEDTVFSDVKDNQFYTDAVLWAADKGVTEGMGDGTFGIALLCNRAHIVTFLYRASQLAD